MKKILLTICPMTLLAPLRRFAREFPGHFLATCLSLLILSSGAAFAATSYDVHNVPQMYLRSGITTTQTTGIQITGPVRNGSRVHFPTTSGGVLEITSGDYVEHIYYSRATVDNATKVITLTGSVIRDLYWNDCTRYAGDGAGRNWGLANVRLVDDCRLLNRKANTDRQNVFTGSGAIRLSGSGSLQLPYFASTAERDRQRPSPQPFEQACVTATNLCYAWIGGTWTAYGNTGVGNADTTTAGIVELATVADQRNRTGAGDSAAQTVLLAKHLTSSGSQAHNPNNSLLAGRIPMLNSSGVLAASLGGLGRANTTSGSVVIAQGTGAVKAVAPGTVNNVLISNGTSWTAGSSPTYCKIVFASTGSSLNLGVSSNTKNVFTPNSYTIPASDIKAGVTYRFNATGTGAWAAGNVSYFAQLGGSDFLVLSQFTPSGAYEWSLKGEFSGTAAAGASVQVRGTSHGVIAAGGPGVDASNYVDYNRASFATNGDLAFTLAEQFSSSNGGNATQLTYLTLEKCASTPY